MGHDRKGDVVDGGQMTEAQWAQATDSILRWHCRIATLCGLCRWRVMVMAMACRYHGRMRGHVHGHISLLVTVSLRSYLRFLHSSSLFVGGLIYYGCAVPLFSLPVLSSSHFLRTIVLPQGILSHCNAFFFFHVIEYVSFCGETSLDQSGLWDSDETVTFRAILVGG